MPLPPKKTDAAPQLAIADLFRAVTFRDVAQGNTTQTGENAATLKKAEKMRCMRAIRREVCEEVLPALPADGESLLCIHNGNFDGWDLIRRAVELLGEPVDHLFLSTWTVSAPICKDIFSLVETGHVRRLTFWLNEYLQQRAPEIWAYSLIQCDKLGGRARLFATQNHAKLATMRSVSGRCITIHGSANLTANPRMENSCITAGAAWYEHITQTYATIEPRHRVNADLTTTAPMQTLEQIAAAVAQNARVLILFQGLPGSGKSTAAAKLAALLHLATPVRETDTFFTHPETGAYLYAESRLKDAHTWCRLSAAADLHTTGRAIVANTLTTDREIQDYHKTAAQYGVRRVVLIRCTAAHGNIHNVPPAVLTEMKTRLANTTIKPDYAIE